MRRVILTVLLIACALPAVAQSPFPWPKKLVPQPTVEWKKVTKADAPPGIGWVAPPDDATEDASRIAYIDLNGSGTPHVIVDDRQGGTAGGTCSVYRKEGGAYECVAWLPLGFSFCARFNGYYQIEGWSRSGGGEYTRMLFRFQKGRYHLIRLEDYRGEGDDATYLGSRSPVQNDVDPAGEPGS